MSKNHLMRPPENFLHVFKMQRSQSALVGENNRSQRLKIRIVLWRLSHILRKKIYDPLPVSARQGVKRFLSEIGQNSRRSYRGLFPGFAKRRHTLALAVLTMSLRETKVPESVTHENVSRLSVHHGKKHRSAGFLRHIFAPFQRMILYCQIAYAFRLLPIL